MEIQFGEFYRKEQKKEELHIRKKYVSIHVSKVFGGKSTLGQPRELAKCYKKNLTRYFQNVNIVLTWYELGFIGTFAWEVFAYSFAADEEDTAGS